MDARSRAGCRGATRDTARETGQTLDRHGHHKLALRARTNAIPHSATGRCHRQAPGPIEVAAAAVLYRVLAADPRADVGRPRHPDEIDAAQRLIAAGLIEEYGAALQPTVRRDATFDYSRRYEPPYLSAPSTAADTKLAKPLTRT